MPIKILCATEKYLGASLIHYARTRSVLAIVHTMTMTFANQIQASHKHTQTILLHVLLY